MLETLWKAWDRLFTPGEGGGHRAVGVLLAAARSRASAGSLFPERSLDAPPSGSPTLGELQKPVVYLFDWIATLLRELLHPHPKLRSNTE
jgi:hypothetical protein